MAYTRGLPPTDPKKLTEYLLDELNKLERAFNDQLPFVRLKLTTVAPTKPRDGMILYADGSNWKPNGAGGKGIWYYRLDTTTWVQLG